MVNAGTAMWVRTEYLLLGTVRGFWRPDFTDVQNTCHLVSQDCRSSFLVFFVPWNIPTVWQRSELLML